MTFHFDSVVAKWPIKTTVKSQPMKMLYHSHKNKYKLFIINKHQDYYIIFKIWGKLYIVTYDL